MVPPHSDGLQVLLFAIILFLFNTYFSDFNGEIYSPKLFKGATLTRDEHGIPTIIADDYSDGVFALGFTHAEDRLWQMFIGYKLALGEVSEIFGEKGIEFDKFMKMLNFLPICQSTLKTFSDEEKKNLQAYTDGVNHYINTVKVLPIEFLVLGQGKFEWKNEYTCLSIKIVEYYLSSDFLREIVRDYLVNRKMFTQEEIEKLFPYKIEHFESQNTIIKNNEAKMIRKAGQKFETQQIKDVYSFRKSKAEIADEEDFARRVAFYEKMRKEQIEKAKKEAAEKEAAEKKEEEAKKKQGGHKVEKEIITDTVTPTQQIRATKRQVKKEEPEEPKLEKPLSEMVKDTKKVEPIQTQEPPRPVSSANIGEMKIENTKHDLNAGSNNYVFSGSVTEDGNPILGNDPHLHDSMPAFWYMTNMKIGNKFHFVGVTHPGSSCFFIGQNGKFAWGITIGFADIADFYKLEIEKVNTTDLSFTLDDPKKVHHLVNRSEIIYTDKERTPEKAQTFYYLDSEIGPVLNGYEDSLFSVANLGSMHNLIQDDYNYYILRSTFTNKYDGNFKSLMNFHQAVDMKSMHEVLKNITMSLNIVYASVDNHIGYHLTGKVPKRKKIGEGAYPIPLTKEENLKIEYIPFDELPHLEDPKRGYIVTANNPIMTSDYMHILQGGFIGDSRSRSLEKKIDNYLKKGKKINVDFVIKEIINNVHDSQCDDLLETLKKFESSNEKLLILSELEGFNCDMDRDSKQALIYNVFLNKLSYKLSYYNNSKIINDWDLNRMAMDSEERANFLMYKLNQYVKNPEQCKVEYKKETCVEFLNNAYTSAIKFISTKLTEDEKYWRWDNLNVKVYPHLPFAQVPVLDVISSRRVKTNGNLYTPKTSGSKVFYQTYEAFLSSNLKYVTHLNKEEFYISIDCGNSGNLLREHYDDLCKSHEQSTLIKFDYKQKVEKASKKPLLSFIKGTGPKKH